MGQGYAAGVICTGLNPESPEALFAQMFQQVDQFDITGNIILKYAQNQQIAGNGPSVLRKDSAGGALRDHGGAVYQTALVCAFPAAIHQYVAGVSGIAFVIKGDDVVSERNHVTHTPGYISGTPLASVSIASHVRTMAA